MVSNFENEFLDQMDYLLNKEGLVVALEWANACMLKGTYKMSVQYNVIFISGALYCTEHCYIKITFFINKRKEDNRWYCCNS